MPPAAQQPIERIAVIGAGAWGTALATVARRAGRMVDLWAREPDIAATIAAKRENVVYLPGIAIDAAISVTNDLVRAVGDAEAILLVVPAQHLRAVVREIAAVSSSQAPIVICAKGIERGTLKLMSEVVAECLPDARLAALSGPTFAAEVARGLPTAVTLASDDAELGQRLAAAIGTATFRPYLGDDLIGAQIGGAVKNVIAIACGIVEGRGLGENAGAALMTRGLAEIMRLGAALGAKRDTLMGLSGLGDLSLTCNSEQSRNMSLGIALGRGWSLEHAVAAKPSIAEGVASAESVSDLAAKLGVDMPIVNSVDGILHHFADLDATIAALLARPFKQES